MELRQLRYFVTVAEELHFGRAADRLRVVQPAVSQQLSRLEREVGLRLLDRSSRRVRLTPAGERLLVEARAALAAADRVAAVAAELAATPVRVLRVGMSPGLGARLARGLEILRQTNSALDIELELVATPVVEQLAAVARGEMDLALLRAVPAGEGLQVLELWPEPVAVALPASHPLAGRPAVRLRDLAALPLRIPARASNPPFHDFALGACRAEGFEPRLGRPTCDAADTLVEIGNGPPTWALTYADAGLDAGTLKASVIQLDPPLTASGCLVVSTAKAPTCVQSLGAAFGSTVMGPPEVTGSDGGAWASWGWRVR